MGIHRSPVDSHHKELVMWSFDIPFVVSLKKPSDKVSNIFYHDKILHSLDIE